MSQANKWYVRVYSVTFNQEKVMEQEDSFDSYEAAKAHHHTQTAHCAVLNAVTRRDKTYYVEEVFHACG